MLDAAVERDGATVKGSRGQLVVNPALSEARQLELVQLRLLSALELVDPKASRTTPTEARARRGASARWNRGRSIRAGLAHG